MSGEVKWQINSKGIKMSALDLSLLRQFSSETLVTMLRQIPGDKVGTLVTRKNSGYIQTLYVIFMLYVHVICYIQTFLVSGFDY